MTAARKKEAVLVPFGKGVDWMGIEENAFYTPDEVARLLKVSRRTVYELLRSHELVGIRIGRSWRISQEALDEYVTWQSLKQIEARQSRPTITKQQA